jgi:putative FmdB family regulatory protein
MPLYTYTCEDHGEFGAWSSMSASDEPQACPACSEPAPRALARPAIGGRSSGGDEMACGMGSCGESFGETGGGMMGGGCCGGGMCMH